MTKLRERMKNKKGFTLVELIIVIAILGILAVVAIPSVFNAVDNARKSADLTTARNIANEIGIKMATKSEYGGLTTATMEVKAYTDASATDVQDLVNEVVNAIGNVKPKYQSTDKEFYVSITKDVGVKVYIGTAVDSVVEVFPNAPDAYTK